MSYPFSRIEPGVYVFIVSNILPPMKFKQLIILNSYFKYIFNWIFSFYINLNLVVGGKSKKLSLKIGLFKI